MSKKITISAMVISLYIIMIFLFQSFSFGAIQIRMANCLYALPVVYPFLVIPLGIAVVLSNLVFGGLGIIDICCGFVVAILTAYTVSKLKKNWLLTIPIILIPGLLVPIWLSYLIHIPYITLMPTVLIGQIIPSIVGVLIIKRNFLKDI